ncbi:TlpA family protein disulfide reductase [Nocardioides coralli]|uniref:TlpA family protein disulfide reductase n=1 Tax=Nocardioides coralli TaxID=2872154 RepID=UPI001CA38806|nr:TlpA disulfide reductase family protein [Nocardioides coralli]QZY29361.1 TlpA family protein disulfide reductase [Nocardioides coralli]
MSRLPAALAVAVLVLTGCSAEPQTPPPGEARIAVDTPQLRELKAEAGVADCEPGDADPVEGGLPAVTLPCLGGGPAVDLSRLRGPMVVNLWQSTCQPCREEMPILQRFHEQHGDRVSVLGIDYQDVQAVAAMELVLETGVTYPLLADPQSTLDGADPFPPLRGMPFLALVDADGTVVHRQFIALRSERQLLDLVDEHLGIAL